MSLRDNIDKINEDFKVDVDKMNKDFEKDFLSLDGTEVDISKNVEVDEDKKEYGYSKQALDPYIALDRDKLEEFIEDYLEGNSYMRYRGTSLPTSDIREWDTYTTGTGTLFIYNWTSWVKVEENP